VCGGAPQIELPIARRLGFELMGIILFFLASEDATFVIDRAA